jgi:hypothetical protein
MRFTPYHRRQTKNADWRNLAGQRRPRACKICLSLEKVKGALASLGTIVNHMQQSLAAGLTASSLRAAIHVTIQV